MSAQGPDRADGDRDVLSNLPRSRPHRRSSKREGVPATASKAATKVEASSPAAGPARPADTVKATRKTATQAKAAPKRARPAAQEGAAATRATGSTGASAGATRAVPRAQRLRTPPPPPSPIPPRSGKTEPPRGESQPSGAALVGTVVQAAGELAQVGLTIGGQVLKRAVSRLPKP